MAPEVEILESRSNEPNSACSVWSNLASACLCNDTEISLFSLFAATWRLWTKRSHQTPEREKINEPSVYFVPKVFDRTTQNQGEFSGPPELLAETRLLSAPLQLYPVVMEVPLPPMSPPGGESGSSLPLGTNGSEFCLSWHAAPGCITCSTLPQWSQQ